MKLIAHPIPKRYFFRCFLLSIPILCHANPCLDRGVWIDEAIGIFHPSYPPVPVQLPDGSALVIHQTEGDGPLTQFQSRINDDRGNKLYSVAPDFDPASVSLWREDIILETELYHPWYSEVRVPVGRLIPLANGDFMAVTGSTEYLFWAPNPSRGNFNPDEPITAALGVGTQSAPRDLRQFLEFLGIYDPETGEFQYNPAELPRTSIFQDGRDVAVLFDYGDPGNPGSYDPATNTAPDGWGQDLLDYVAFQKEVHGAGFPLSPQFLWSRRGNWPNEDRGSYYLVFQRLKPDGSIDPAYATAIIPAVSRSTDQYYDVAPDGSVRILGPSPEWLNTPFADLGEFVDAFQCPGGIIALGPDGQLDEQRSFRDCEGKLYGGSYSESARVQVDETGTFWVYRADFSIQRQSVDGNLENAVPLAIPESLAGRLQEHYLAGPFFVQSGSLRIGFYGSGLPTDLWSGVLAFSGTGEPDPDWHFPTGATLNGKGGTVREIYPVGSSHCLVVGNFDAFNGLPARNAALLDANGRVQPFVPIAALERYHEEQSGVGAMHFSPPDHLLITGNLETACGTFSLVDVDLSEHHTAPVWTEHPLMGDVVYWPTPAYLYSSAMGYVHFGDWPDLYVFGNDYPWMRHVQTLDDGRHILYHQSPEGHWAIYDPTRPGGFWSNAQGENWDWVLFKSDN